MFGTLLRCNRELGHEGAHIPLEDEPHTTINFPEMKATACEVKLGT